ncbi:MAG: TetM/TetW/TetO/TetS family tetracycline resistance ribosomal protection protein [Eubacteriales bacterium]|nr:TetM/TetW/TetO/TetS family tetracycline resistance ribosomal protection protein [Eubacteriales bacterium]
MEDKIETQKKQQLCMAMLAHVDAGKTTLSEAVLYKAGRLRKPGRVDHGDAFLDTFSLEKRRGITIFSKQAVFSLGEKEVTLLDTPGHVDFSAEMERALWVLDYAVLIVSGADGIQAHTETLWRLLRAYKIPTFLFINKMDQEGTDRDALMEELRRELDDGCIPFDGTLERETLLEEIAMCDEDCLEQYMEEGDISLEEVQRVIRERKVFPCYFGSALKLTGIETFLEGLSLYMTQPCYPQDFGAKIYKIARDDQGSRLTYMKVTGGSLRVKMPLSNGEKADQIRIYSGAKYETKEVAEAGTVCAVTGLLGTSAGQGLGAERSLHAPFLEPVLRCRMILPEGADVSSALRHFRQLEEEDPMLHFTWDSRLMELQVHLMGQVQTEVLKSLIKERFGMDVSFGAGHILYRETIKNTVSGVGHYEPLRHYAEVHLRMDPGEPGSGLVFATECSEDRLDGNWQRLILTHLREREHPGVLAGMPITDMKISLTAGKAHQKHTEGGDFRQATYRAVRQGLKSAESVLLEPWYAFRLELPGEQVGRAMADVQKMHGSFEPPRQEGERAILEGEAPVSEMMDYAAQVQSYTGGRGRLSLRLSGYQPCHNEEEVLEAIGYDSEADVDNPTGSVFCSHGAGFYVPWNEVPDYMHLKEEGKDSVEEFPEERRKAGHAEVVWDEELEAIYEREFGKKQQEQDLHRRFRKKMGNRPAPDSSSRTYAGILSERKKGGKEYLLVDGYNIIFAWEFLKELSEASLEAARNKLMDLLCNYQGFVGCTVIVVFDAYKVKGNPGEITKYHNIHVVYTREAETADQYIEKTTHELGKNHLVTVATSDSLEQVIVMGQGARKISAPDFLEEMERVETEIRRIHEEKKQRGKNYLFNHADQKTATLLEEVRLGKASLKSKGESSR